MNQEDRLEQELASILQGDTFLAPEGADDPNYIAPTGTINETTSGPTIAQNPLTREQAYHIASDPNNIQQVTRHDENMIEELQRELERMTHGESNPRTPEDTLSQKEREAREKREKDYYEAQTLLAEAEKKKREQERERKQVELMQNPLTKNAELITTRFMDLVITHDDLVIGHSLSGKTSIKTYHITFENKKHSISYIQQNRRINRGDALIPGSEMRSNVISTDLLYDGNLQPLFLNVRSHNNTPVREDYGKRVYLRELPTTQSDADAISHPTHFFIVDKKKYLLSHGEDVDVKAVSMNNSVGSMVNALDFMKNKISIGIEDIKRIKSIGVVTHKDNFGVMGSIAMHRSENYYAMNFLIKDVTIRNSRAESHYIGDMMIRLKAKRNTTTTTSRLIFLTGMWGHRISWTMHDLFGGYAHSHLHVNNIKPYDSFCIGEAQLFRSRDGNMIESLADVTDLEIEQLFLAVDIFASWESLEGGPYIRFGSIGNGNRPSTFNPILSIPRNNSQSRASGALIDGYNGAYSRDLFTFIMARISDHKKEFRQSFSMQKIDGEHKFVCNKRLFIETLIDHIPDNTVLGIDSRWYYDLATGKTYYTNGNRNNNSNYSITDGRQRIYAIEPVNLDTKIVRAKLVDQTVTEQATVYRRIFNPKFTDAIIHFMLNNLNEELYHDSKKSKTE